MKRGRDKGIRKSYRIWSKEEKYEFVKLIISGEVSAKELAKAYALQYKSPVQYRTEQLYT